MLSRDVLNALFPKGSFWEPEQGSDYDNLLEGIAENSEYVRQNLDDLRYIRNPYKTTLLSDLEKEYGVVPVPLATDTERRDRLASIMFMRNELPTSETLQEKLQAAGFDVYVHDNDPAVDPAIFLDKNFQMTASDLLPGGNEAQAGEPEAYAGRVGGDLLVNGQIFNQFPNYIIQAGEPDIQAGEPDALAGQYDSIRLELIEYELPTESGYWPLIFFVGGQATRDPVTNEITAIDIAQIPIARQKEFRSIILQQKPMHSWAGLIVVYS